MPEALGSLATNLGVSDVVLFELRFGEVLVGRSAVLGGQVFGASVMSALRFPIDDTSLAGYVVQQGHVVASADTAPPTRASTWRPTTTAWRPRRRSVRRWGPATSRGGRSSSTAATSAPGPTTTSTSCSRWPAPPVWPWPGSGWRTSSATAASGSTSRSPPAAWARGAGTRSSTRSPCRRRRWRSWASRPRRSTAPATRFSTASTPTTRRPSAATCSRPCRPPGSSTRSSGSSARTARSGGPRRGAGCSTRRARSAAWWGCSSTSPIVVRPRSSDPGCWRPSGRLERRRRRPEGAWRFWPMPASASAPPSTPMPWWPAWSRCACRSSPTSAWSTCSTTTASSRRWRRWRWTTSRWPTCASSAGVEPSWEESTACTARPAWPGAARASCSRRWTTTSSGGRRSTTTTWRCFRRFGASPRWWSR